MENGTTFELELAEYKRKEADAEVEFGLWHKVGFGIALGLIVMAVILGQWSTGEYDSGPYPTAQRIALGLINLMIVGYFIRRHLIKKKLTKLWLAIPLQVRKRDMQENGLK